MSPLSRTIVVFTGSLTFIGLPLFFLERVTSVLAPGPPPKSPCGLFLPLSARTVTVISSVSAWYDRMIPVPPRWRPSPALSGLNSYCLTTNGYDRSISSMGVFIGVGHVSLDAIYPVLLVCSPETYAYGFVESPVSALVDSAHHDVIHRAARVGRDLVWNSLRECVIKEVGVTLACLKIAACDRMGESRIENCTFRGMDCDT